MLLESLVTMLSSGTHAAGFTGGNAEFWNTCSWIHLQISGTHATGVTYGNAEFWNTCSWIHWWQC